MLYKLTVPLILASASPVRHKMLLEMEVSHRVIVSPIDEEQKKKILNIFLFLIKQKIWLT